LLLRSGAIAAMELARSIGLASARNVPLWDFLVLERQVPEEILADAFSTWLSVPRLRLDSVVIDAEVLNVISARLARKHTCLPIRFSGKALLLAMANPLDRQAIKDVEFAAGRPVRPVVATRSEILSGIQRSYPGAPGAESEGPTGESPAAPSEFEVPQAAGAIPSSADLAVAVELYGRIVRDAIQLGASDIHVEPEPLEMCVRLRIDGVLRDHLRLPRWMHPALLSRIKVLAQMDLAQQRLPQDGRIRFAAADREIELRVSTLPADHGEKVVLRVLGAVDIPALDSLGLTVDEIALLAGAVNQPQGLVVVTGPAGAGKSTTLYSMLVSRLSADVNVATIEDPIEYHVPGANQVQVDGKSGLSVADCLRAILTQNPDVILVGEIRDPETADAVFQAGLTGHLVFSTLHTNDSIGAIERLFDLGIKPVVLTSATNVIVAQRLARRVCAHCLERYMPAPEVLRRLHIQADDHEFRHGRGCDACAQTGYAGRVGIFEILRLTPRVKDLIIRQAPESELRGAAWADGTRFLMEDALTKVRAGLTTVEEILRVIRTDRAEDRAHDPARPFPRLRPIDPWLLYEQ
jgi:type IV pilus assembly protein PilB